ncbi:FAD-binding protein [Saccharopolyspora karakumensis]|uniref:FAD-binding protein n=1 Tax=Saccharopolyspora karakumensis TaxID=2530386 RepID=A0A4R5BP85_9PSEU|nr:NAD(P)-binding protein [Saccharopolyspora karakumensis]TDD87725.1 FAD-binding protein [Saccharopolyspora karakumensis]
MNLRDAIVIGGGQSGLAAAHALRSQGLRPVVLEAGAEPVGSWPRYANPTLLGSDLHWWTATTRLDILPLGPWLRTPPPHRSPTNAPAKLPSKPESPTTAPSSLTSTPPRPPGPTAPTNTSTPSSSPPATAPTSPTSNPSWRCVAGAD